MPNSNFDDIMNDYVNAVAPSRITNKIKYIYQNNDYEALRLFAKFFMELDEPGVNDRSIILSLGNIIWLGEKREFYSIIEAISEEYISNGVFTSIKYEKFLYGWMSMVDLSLILDNRVMDNINFPFNYLQIFVNIISIRDIFELVVDTPEFLALRKGIVESGKVSDVSDMLQFLHRDKYSMNKFYEGMPSDYQLGIAI